MYCFKVSGALGKIQEGALNVAAGMLNAFINQVQDFINDDILTSAEGQLLIDLAQAIIDDLNNSARLSEAGSVLEGSQELAEALPETYSLSQNYPNPFNPSTEIDFALPEATPVQLVVYDIMGREVARLVDGVLPAGQHRATWQAEGVPSGVYLYRITAGAFTETRRMVLLK